MPAALPERVIDSLRPGPASARELAARLAVSQPTLSRTLRPLEAQGRVVRFGTTRGARYGLTRNVRAIGHRWPLYRIDEVGVPHEVATVIAVERDHYYARSGPPRVARLADGLPYFLQDARPTGFIGRAIPQRFPELELPARVVDWTDDHVLTYLARRGADVVGDLVLGEEALDRYLAGQESPPLVHERDRATRFPALAQQAMQGTLAGSSAQGEHPKFSVRIERDGTRTPAFVKFSPPRDSPAGERWADLLVAEALASDVLNAADIPAARSRVIDAGDRRFLESERFDRIGDDGRRGTVSLLAVAAEHHGELDTWARAARRLCDDGLLSEADADLAALLDAFGALIANTDRHLGNLTLFDLREGPFELAPVYDMLPMLFAPSEGDVVERAFEPGGARSETLRAWPRARELALTYWNAIADDPRVTAGFRQRARDCRELVARASLRRRSSD